MDINFWGPIIMLGFALWVGLIYWAISRPRSTDQKPEKGQDFPDKR